MEALARRPQEGRIQQPDDGSHEKDQPQAEIHDSRDLAEHQEQHGQNARDLQRLSARLVEALEQERRAVARELHDEVGQALTAIKMELSHAERARPGELPVGALEAARVATDSALHTVRDLTRLLHPRILDELGLVAAVETLVREFSRRTGVATELDHDEVEGRLDARVSLCAYRIVQEALTNVGRHAAAEPGVRGDAGGVETVHLRNDLYPFVDNDIWVDLAGNTVRESVRNDLIVTTVEDAATIARFVLDAAVAKLHGFEPAHLGIEVGAMVEQAAAARAKLARDGAAPSTHAIVTGAPRWRYVPQYAG